MTDVTGYRFLECLHTGRHVAIHRALELSRERPVLVKTPLARESDAEALRSFAQETALAEQMGGDVGLPFRLVSPELPAALEAGPVEGATLRQAMQGAPVEIGVFWERAIQLARLIDRLHRTGHVHHNVHPELIWIDHATGDLRFLDFSYATPMDHPGEFVLAGHQLESLLPYISPEQTGRLAFPPDYRTDLYSCGVIMYEWLTGELPITADKPEEWVHGHLARTIADPRKRRADIPEPLAALVMKCLAKHPDDRFQSASGLIGELLRCRVSGGPSSFRAPADVPLHFRIPSRQYGREETLASIASRLRDGSIIFISGDPGIGKTSLLEEIRRLSSRRDGFCLWGKFEQYKQEIPYQPLIEVFRQFVVDTLGGEAGEVERWKSILLDALGRNASLITEFIPQMAHMIGPQPKAEPLLPAEAQQRFHLTLTRFLEALLQHARPLTLIMDDLQWAGPESLAMLERIAELGELYKPTLICAYRPTDAMSNRPLSGTMDAIRSGRLPVREYALHPLRPDDTLALVSDVLHEPPSACRELAEHIHRVSGGTPQFVKELLSALHKEKGIRFHIREWRWQWDMAAIQTFRVSEDIRELLDRSIRQLSPACVEMLGMAACVGTVFDSGLLAGAGGIPAERLAGLLREAVQAGLIAAHRRSRYRFVHDRILEAVRESLSADRLRLMHYRIGAYMRERLSDEERQEQLYDMVNHLNAGLPHLPADARRPLAELNLEAGRKAKSSNAFHTALTFLRFGIGLLADDAWDSDYELNFALHREWLECEYLCGNYEQTRQLFDTIIGRVRTPLERAGMYVILALNYRRSDRSEEAIDAGMKGLEELAYRISRSPSRLRLLWESVMARLEIRRVRPEDIPDLPVARDEDVRIAAQLMAIISPCAYLTSTDLLAMIGFALTRLSLRHGNHHHAAEGYILYAMVTGLHFGNYDTGMRIGQAGLAVSERHGSLASRFTANFAFGAFFGHWIRPLREIEPYLVRAIDLCMRTGDWTYATYSVHYYLGSLLYRGETLPKLAEAIAEYEHKARGMKEPMFRLTLRLFDQFQLALRGKTRHPLTWDDDTFSEDAYLQEVRLSGMADYKQFDYDVLKLQTGYLMGDYEAAWRHAECAERYRKRFIGVHMMAELSFYGALAALERFRLASGRQRKKIGAYVRAKRQELFRWAQNCPENFLCKQLLIDAEIARCSRRYERAAALYERAAEAAAEQGFVHIQAIAYECAARWYGELGRGTAAEAYMKQAHRLYDRWGARAKCADLESKFPDWLREETDRLSESSVSPDETASTAERNLSDLVDAAAVVNAVQAVSGEMDEESLLKKLMTVVIQTASADKGCLFLWKDDKPLMEARGELQDGTAAVEVLQSQPLDELSDLAHSVIHYTARTHEIVVLRHAAAEGPFRTDPHIAQHQVKSLLCLPVLHKNRLIGVLYLENKLSIGVFTPDRVHMLQMLSAQTAISLQNARLYFSLQMLNAELEDKVKERTANLLQSMRETAAALAEKSILEERNRIAREIHDTVGHALTSINLSIEAGKRLLDRDRTQALEKLEQSQEQVRSGIKEIKKALKMLREGVDAKEFSPSLERFIQDTIRKTGVKIRYKPETLPPLTSAQQYVLYRALQEGITNGIRHGESDEFDFSLKLEDGVLKFRLADYGGGRHTIRYGFGLTAMKERVEELGGSLQVQTEAGQGCRLEIELPYKSPAFAN